MVFQNSHSAAVQWIESWQHRLSEVARHVQPWTCAAGGMPDWTRNQPKIFELVELMENRVQRLATIVSQQQSRIADSWTIAYIERELADLLDVAKTFDHSLRESPRDNISAMQSTHACAIAVAG